MSNPHDYPDGYAEAALETELGLFPAGFGAGVRDALGSDPSAPLPGGIGLVTHLLQVAGDVTAAYLLTAGGLIIYEQATDGSTLCIGLPAFRISRVEVRTRPDGAVRALFEIDADTVSTSWTDAANGVSSKASYVIVGEAESAPAVAAFATELRCYITGL